MYIYIYIHILLLYVHIHVHVCVYIHTHVHKNIHTRQRALGLIHTQAYIHKHTCAGLGREVITSIFNKGRTRLANIHNLEDQKLLRSVIELQESDFAEPEGGHERIVNVPSVSPALFKVIMMCVNLRVCMHAKIV